MANSYQLKLFVGCYWLITNKVSISLSLKNRTMNTVFYLYGQFLILSVHCDDYISGENDLTIFDVDKGNQTILNEDEELHNLVESDCEVKINTINSIYVNCENRDLLGANAAMINK